MAEKSATPEDQSQLAFDTGFGDTAPAETTEKVETKPKEDKPEPKPVAKAKEPPKKTETKADEKPAPEYVQITKEQMDRFEAAANKTGDFEKQFSKAFGSIGNMQQLLNKLQAATPKGEEIKLPDDVVDELKAEFPELAGHIRTALEKALKAGMRGTGEEKSEADKDPAGEALRKERITLAVEELEDAYPDWKDIVGAVSDGKFDPTHPFRSWLATQPEDYQQKVNGTNNPRVIERAIDRFKEFEAAEKAKAKKPEPPKPNPQTESRKQALREAVQPRGSGPEPTQNKTEADHFSEGFAAG